MMDVRAQETTTVQDESDFDTQMVTKGMFTVVVSTDEHTVAP